MPVDKNGDGVITIKEVVNFIITEIFRGNVLMIVLVGAFVWFIAKPYIDDMQEADAYITQDTNKLREEVEEVRKYIKNLDTRESGVIVVDHD